MARRTTRRKTTRRTTRRKTTRRTARRTARRTTRRTTRRTAKRTTRRKTRRTTAAKKYYIMKVGRTEAIFTGRQPRQAALKAATRGYTDIRLRERGRRNRDRTYTIHIFKGRRKQVRVEGGPEWLPAKVWKPVVRKMKIQRVNRI